MKRFFCCVLSIVLIFALMSPMALASERRDFDPPWWYRWGYESLEELLQEWGIDEDYYYAFVEEEIRWEEERDQWQADWDRRFEEEVVRRGGTAGIVNVMYNGRFVQFSDAVPVIIDGVTIAPAEPILAMLDASMAAHIEAAQIIKDGAAYIPIRAAFEAVGSDVFWDQNHRTAVILNRPEIIAGIDRNFTAANELLGMPFADLGARRTAADAALTITMFDSISGDNIYEVVANAVILQDGTNFSMSGTLDATGLLSLIASDYFFGALPIEQLLGNLKFDFDIIMGDGVLYIRSPLFDVIAADYLPPGAWASFDLDDILADLGLDVFMSLPEGGTVGELIYEPIVARRWASPINFYETIMAEAEYEAEIFGDSNITRRGNDFTLTATYEDGSRWWTTSVDLDVTVRTDGSYITAITGSFIYDESDFQAIRNRIRVELDFSATGMSLIFEVHERNEYRILLEITANTSPHRGDIPNAPPSGATIIPIY